MPVCYTMVPQRLRPFKIASKCLRICHERALYLHDIILSSQVEGLPSNVEGDDRQRGDLLTVNEVLKMRQRRRKCQNMKMVVKSPTVLQALSAEPANVNFLTWGNYCDSAVPLPSTAAELRWLFAAL